MSALTEDVATNLLDTLAKYGGEDPPQPEHLSAQEAQAYVLRRREEEANQLAKHIKRFPYLPVDGAVAMQRVLQRLFGTTGQEQTIQTMFGPKLPEMHTVQIGVGETMEVPFGDTEVAFPIFGEGAYFRNHERRFPGGVVYYELRFTAPKRFAAHIRGLQKEVEKELATNSIYRGKAFNGSGEFVDLDTIDPAQVVYNEATEAQIKADLWSLVEHSDTLRGLGIPMKHAVLLPGDYGTGKTLLGLVTGQKALANGWTFIQCRPGRDNYQQVMNTAKLYQPCIAFFEDIDTFGSEGDDNPLAQLLDTYDGMTAKGAEIVAVFTTNHPERIHKGMVRPGRIDAVIPIGAQDIESIQRIIETTLDPKVVDGVDFDAVATAMEGFTPAFIKEAIHRAVRHAIVRVDGDVPNTYATIDFLNAAASMQAHLSMMQNAKEGERSSTLASALEDVIVRSLADRIMIRGGGVELDVYDVEDDE